jgi:UDP-N-acetylmuramoyl-L-alanine---L-glutamate ligase
MRFSALDGAALAVWGVGRETRSLAAQVKRRLPEARINWIILEGAVTGDPDRELGIPPTRKVAPEEAAGALLGCDLVVRSPGVSIYRPELAAIRAAGIPVTTATAMWFEDRGGENVIGITGTKGKSTTAALVHHLLQETGALVHLAGNIGRPALDLLDMPSSETAVVELSSYQISDLAVGPEIAVMTNLFQEHVDWHGSASIYRADKLRIFGLRGVRAAVVNGKDPQLTAASSASPERNFFGVDGGWHVNRDGVAFADDLRLRADELPLLGDHNALNLCAALAALDSIRVHVAGLKEALADFRALPHRLETVADQAGVLWVDDSISTTPESTIAAISSFPDRQIVLIGGGQDRDQDYHELGRVLAQRDAAVLGVPTTGERLVAAARQAGISAERAREVSDIASAVQLARSLATQRSVVLLSPAAPSYNSHRNFEERGDHFRALIDA